MNEIRNELLILRNIIKKDEQKTVEKIIDYGMLLEKFKFDLTEKKENLQNELEKVNNNIEILESIIKELNIKI